MSVARIAAIGGAVGCALATAGCESILGLGEPTLAVICDDGRPKVTRQFVIDSFDAPNDAAEVGRFAFDVDGDDLGDNTIFSSLVTFGSGIPELDLQPTINSLLVSGALLQLLEAELGDSCAQTTMYLGEDRDTPPNPDDNFSGDESFRVASTLRGRMTGAHIDDGVLGGPGGSTELRLPLFSRTTPIDLPLVEAQIRYIVTDEGAIEGAIGGAIRADVVNGVVLPSLALSLQDVVTRDCAGGTPPMCCPDGTDGRGLLNIFDDDDDCALSIEEVRDDALVQSIFGPDVDLYNGGVLEPNVDGVKDAVSIGLGFTAVNAFFLTL